MKKVAVVIIIILIVLLITVAVVYAAAHKQLALLKQSEYKVDQVKVARLNITEGELLLDSSFQNLSDVDFTVTGYDVFISINNVFVSRLQASGLNLLVPALSTTQLPQLSIVFNPLTVAMSALNNLSNASMNIRGTVKAKYKMFSADAPVDKTINMRDFV